MLRIGAARLLSQRTISTSSPVLVRIRSQNPAQSNPSPTSPSDPSTKPSTQKSGPTHSSTSQHPSPAEEPPSPPAGVISEPPPFEPQVYQPSSSLPPHTAESVNIEPPSSTSSTSEATASTPETEADEAGSIPYDKSKLPSLDIDPDIAIAAPKEGDGSTGEGGRTGAKGREYVSSMERQRRAYLRFLLGATAIGALGGAYYLSQDESGQGGGRSQWETLKQNTGEIFDVFSKPAFKVLLPDPLPPPHQRPYTLVVDLEGLLVSSTWSRESGWKTAKRPGVDYFLGYLSQFYEIVLFTSQPLYVAAPIAEKLDPFGAYVPFKLFRDSTRTYNGKVVKDLSYLNRDLKKVIMIDTNAEHTAVQPENSIVVKAWERQPGDRGLIDLIPFLESIAMFNAQDVRPVLQAYAGKDIPIEYAKKEAELKQKAIEEWERKNPPTALGSSSGFLSGLFGSVAAPGKARSNQPMTYLDQKREEAQKNYLAEQKYWKDNEEEFKKMIEEDKKKQMAEMSGSLLGYFGGGAPKKSGEPKA